MAFEKLRFQNAFRPHSHKNAKPAFSNFFRLRGGFDKLCFRDGLVWTVGLTVEIKLRFQIMDEASFKDNISQYTLPQVSNPLPLNVKSPVKNLQELAVHKN